MSEANPNSRLEAFCDGVFAIDITLLIIDIKIPSDTEIKNTADFWHVLYHILPSIIAFVLSFIVILITWVNHHSAVKLVNKSSSAFIYSNGLLLLTVVSVPFPTSLVGEYVRTDHATPAVLIYNTVLAIQGIAWVLVSGSAIKNNLAKNEKSLLQLIENKKNGYIAFAFYSLLAVLSLWFPLTIAIITFLTWVFWLIYGISIKHE